MSLGMLKPERFTQAEHAAMVEGIIRRLDRSRAAARLRRLDAILADRARQAARRQALGWARGAGR
mgnify:CR=1 FL=1